MRRVLMSVVLFSISCVFCGCSDKSLGPADPDSTPEVDQAEVDAMIREGMEKGGIQGGYESGYGSGGGNSEDAGSTSSDESSTP
jgi:hypothetical protein